MKHYSTINLIIKINTISYEISENLKKFFRPVVFSLPHGMYVSERR